MSTDDQFLQPEALDRFTAEAQAFPTVLAEFVAAVSALTDAGDVEQLRRRDESAAALQLAMARLNSAEYDYSGEMSFWAADDDEGYNYDEEDADADDDGVEFVASDDDRLSFLARVDLRVVDAVLLKERAMASLMGEDELTEEEADTFSDSPLQAAQALLPEIAEMVEGAFADFADVNWLYAGVSAGDYDRDEDGFEDILEDEDHRAFHVEIFDNEEDARAAAEAAGVEYDD